MELLRCTRCREEKPGTTEHFPANRNKRNGLDSWCRECRACYQSEFCRGRFRGVISDEALAEFKASIKECVICGKAQSLVVDHDHKTGLVRGILCNHCNRGLGQFRDDPELLELAAEYLRQMSTLGT